MSVRPAWQLWEREVCDSLDGVLVPRSGQGFMHKGDGKTSDLLIDAKHTRGAKYALQLSTWEKVQEWATNEGKEPVVAVRVDGGARGGYSAVVVNEHLACSMFPELDGMEPVAENGSSRSLAEMRPGCDPQLFSLGGCRLVEMDFEDFAAAYRERGLS